MLDKLVNLFQHSERTFLIVVAALIGIGAGFGDIGFILLVKFFNSIFFTGGSDILAFMHEYYIIIIPALGGFLVGLITYFGARDGKGYGVAEVMSSIAFAGGHMPIKPVMIKSLASTICIGSGGSAGLQGPSVHIGSAIGSFIGQVLRVPGKRFKALVACGAAGGIAATFNAPIGGALFAMEVILGEVRVRHISLVIISAVMAAQVSRLFLGNEPAFAVPSYPLYSTFELLFYAVLGIAAGVVAVAYIRTMFGYEDLFKNYLHVPQYLRPVIGGLLVGLIGYFYPQVLGIGYESIEEVLTGKMILSLMVVLVLVKILTTSITLGSGGLGGVFAPALFMGAMLGGASGMIFNYAAPGVAVNPAAYALVGMGAVFAGSAQAPMTAIIMLFEMSGDYQIILPLMVSCVISAIVARTLKRESIYTMAIARRGLDVERAMQPDMLKNVTVGQFMQKKPETILSTLMVREALKLVATSSHQGFPVVDEDGLLQGIITTGELKNAAAQGRYTETVDMLAVKRPVVVTPEDSLAYAAEKMTIFDIGRLPVVSLSKRNKLLGILTRSDIVRAYCYSASPDVQYSSLHEQKSVHSLPEREISD